MLIFLCLTALLTSCVFAILYYLTQRRQIALSLREVFLLTAMTLGCLIVFSTELLSLFTLLTPAALKIVWAAVFLFCISAAAFLARRHTQTFSHLGVELKDRLAAFKAQPWSQKLMLLLVVFQIAVLLLVIHRYPVPNNGDSMRYHLTRILVWEQQASVRHFATPNLHQVSLPAFSEYVVMHINWLTGGDHLARIVQWLALIVAAVAVSVVTQKLGGDSRQQTIAALLSVSLPGAILEATSTQTDLVDAAWLLTFMAFALGFKQHPRKLFWSAATGLALGLAVFTKSTGFIFALPLSLYVAISVIQSEGFKAPVWKAGLVIAAFLLLVNLGQFTRDTITFGSPLGSNLGNTNEVHTLQSLASNTIRDLQLQVPYTDNPKLKTIQSVGLALTGISKGLHQLTGMAPNDPRTSLHEKYSGFDAPFGLNRDENKAGNFLQLVLIGLTIFCVAVNRDWSERGRLAVTFIITLLLFAFLIKTMNVTSRLLMSWFMMWTPLIAVGLFGRSKRLSLIFVLLVWAFSLPWVFGNQLRPLLRSPEQQAAAWPADGVEAYFLIKPNLLPIYEALTTEIMDRGCAQVGLVYTGEKKFFEYPFRMMLQDKGFSGQISFLMVGNPTARYADPQFSACMILSNTPLDDLPDYSLDLTVEDFWLYAEN